MKFKKDWKHLEYLKHCVLPRASIKDRKDILKEINFLENKLNKLEN